MKELEAILDGDQIKKLHPFVLVDIRDYFNLRINNLPSSVKWNWIKSLIITDGGATLWQLSEKYLDSDFRPIGIFEPPATFIEWILEKQKTLK